MKYAIVAPAGGGQTADPDWMTTFAQHVEACGFESLVMVEHTVMVSRYTSTYPYDPSGRVDLAPDCDIPDPVDMLAFLAARTERLGLATGVLVLPNHHPVVLAKRLATVDRVSQGRLRVCVGMGWMQEELEACGVPFTARGRRADEQLRVLRQLWDGDASGTTHEGDFFAYRHAVSRPTPAQSGGVPLHIGGHSRAAARRAGRYGDGLQPLGVSGDELTALVDLMRRTAEENQRDAESLELSLGHLASRIDAEKAASLAALGADRVVLATTVTDDLSLLTDELSACAERLGLC